MLAANKSAKDKIDYEALTVRAFKKAYGIIVKPRTDVRTYNLWLQAGFKVKPGEKATAVKQLRLFHVSQVVEMTKAEKAEALAKLAEKSAARTADKLPAVSPISAPVAPVKTSKAKGRKIIPISEITTAG